MESKVRKIIPFVDCKSEVPIVKFVFDNGDGAFAVVDTGSETTLFDFGLLFSNHKSEFPLKKTRKKINFVGIQNEAETPLIKTSPILKFPDSDNDTGYLHIEVKDAIFIGLANLTQHIKDQYDTDMPISAIFGSDMLSRLNATINYNTKEVVIDYDISSQ